MKKRLNTHDVTNTVNVSDWQVVRDEVCRIFHDVFPLYDDVRLRQAYADLNRFVAGESSLFQPLDTPYHDLQHSLDMSLALARLISGFEKSVSTDQRLGAELATVGLIAGLFHDSGYLRRVDESQYCHGAKFTQTHVSRGIVFLGEYLPQIGLSGWQHVIDKILHFTGYEISIHQIKIDDPKHFNLGSMLGSADLMAQMSDRCYLEKCRDRLYEEFVIAGFATRGKPRDEVGNAIYDSAEDLLSKTPKFVRSMIEHRMEVEFRAIYKYMNCYFHHQSNPYMKVIWRQVAYAEQLDKKRDFSALRRRPGWTLSVSRSVACPGAGA